MPRGHVDDIEHRPAEGADVNGPAREPADEEAAAPPGG
jgi:hypothetical protein